MSDVGTPLVCHHCWPTRENWNEPCMHALAVYQSGHTAGLGERTDQTARLARRNTEVETVLRNVKQHFDRWGSRADFAAMRKIVDECLKG